MHVDLPVERAAQVAVGEHAERCGRRVDDHGHAEALARHLQQPLRSAARRAPRAAPPRRCASGRRRAAAACGRARRPDASARNPARVKPRASSSATASASPMRQRRGGAGGRREVERAGFLGHARRRGARWRRAPASSRALPVIAMSGTPRRFRCGSSTSSSGVSPELDSASTTSARVIMPRSPWLASAGCRKNAGVPVEASVAAILPATWPDLPMPVTTTRPCSRGRCGRRRRSAAVEAWQLSAARARASIRARGARRPEARHRRAGRRGWPAAAGCNPCGHYRRVRNGPM